MKRLILIALTCMLCAAASTVAQAQEINPKLKVKKVPSVLLPDLVVSGFSVGKGAAGEDILIITVKNTCEGAVAKYDVTVDYKMKNGLKNYFTYFPGKGLKGGESETQKHTLAGEPSYSQAFTVQVDKNNKVKEANEGNNWNKLNPNSSPFPDGPNHCKPKN